MNTASGPALGSISGNATTFWNVGSIVGCGDWPREGSPPGGTEGHSDGPAVLWKLIVGDEDGDIVGLYDGLRDGLLEVSIVGKRTGSKDGLPEGCGDEAPEGVGDVDPTKREPGVRKKKMELGKTMCALYGHGNMATTQSVAYQEGAAKLAFLPF